MRHIFVIGMGAGSPEHITYQAARALGEVQAVVALDKGEAKDDLLALRRQILQRHAPEVPLVTVTDPPRDRQPADYQAEVRTWHQRRAQLLKEAIERAVPDGGTVGFLVWGDPSLYDSTLRIIGRMEKLGLECDTRVFAGITAVQALTAAHGIVLNRIGEQIVITTGRNFAATSAKDRRNCVVMLDGGHAWQEAYTEDTYIWWGAYLGTPMEIVREGYVSQVGQELAELKATLRQEHGWIMDIYLVRELD